ncbi:MAG: peptidoglycan recognition family protein [Candidatus Limivivens sp.]|nr:peptidoglycan recognition family protein [Candidatus Limivivens sp.]
MTEEKKSTEEKNKGKERRQRKKLTPQERKRRRQQEVFLQWVILGILVFGSVALVLAYQYGKHRTEPVDAPVQTEMQTETGAQTEEVSGESGILVPRPDIDVQLLTVNPNSRPGIPTDPITAIVIHYLANPGTTAQQNRDYFESLKDLNTEKISSNFVIGLEGEIIQCVPTAEMAYASNSRNHDTVSIENCHPDETGKFNDSTYQSLVHLTAYLCDKFDLDPLNGGVIRHHDVTGKDCPRYFVQNEDAWEQFKQDVADYMVRFGAL